jgi:hypothetical protein
VFGLTIVPKKCTIVVYATKVGQKALGRKRNT